MRKQLSAFALFVVLTSIPLITKAQVPQFASPTFGVAPLDVSFQVANGRSGCGATTKRLIFGDGTYQDITPLSGNTCEVILQRVVHSYVNPGTYRAYVSGGYAQGQEPSAIITVQPGHTTQVVSSQANTSNSAQLAAQAEVLLQQIAALQAQLAAQSGGTIPSVATPTTVVSSSNCPLIGRVLRLGSSGDDVARLQRFLAVDPSIYPEAQVTGYYGPLTEAAVKRWQTRFNIVSSGDAASTGFGVTGPRTAAAISLQCSTYTGGVGGTTVVPSGTPNVGGFIQVTPISGNAPLTTQVVATVNTVNSCDAATYTLNWGDGTVPQSIVVPAGRCGQLQQNYSHIYLYGGTYLIRLSAGEHSTTATVNVYGASGPSVTQTGVTNPGLATISVTAPGSGRSYDAGAKVDIAWVGAGSIPAGSRVYIDVITSSGTKVGNTLDNTSNISGSYQWQIPSGFTPGSYKIRTIIMSGTQTVAIGESPVFTVNTPAPEFSYVPIGVTPVVQNNPLSVAVSFNLPTSCTGYTLSWGDSSSNATQAHSTGCANTPVTRVFTHDYAGSGSYTITLRRGADLSRLDTASVTIAN